MKKQKKDLIAIQIRVTPEDHAKWQKEAEAAMMSLASYVYKRAKSAK